MYSLIRFFQFCLSLKTMHIGNTHPLASHMTCLIKTLNLKMFLVDRGQHESRMRLAKVHVDDDFSAPCKSSVLFPESGGNMHCFKAITPCILLDVLGPPYSEAEGRHCTYYQHYSYDHISLSGMK